MEYKPVELKNKSGEPYHAELKGELHEGSNRIHHHFLCKGQQTYSTYAYDYTFTMGLDCALSCTVSSILEKSLRFYRRTQHSHHDVQHTSSVQLRHLPPN